MNTEPVRIAPRCLTRDQAATYIGTSVDTIDRAIHSGALPMVRLPVERDRKTGKGNLGQGRRILIDVRDLDALIDRSKELRTG
jgi:excisionase family DNA binding protein